MILPPKKILLNKFKNKNYEIPTIFYIVINNIYYVFYFTLFHKIVFYLRINAPINSLYVFS